MAHGIYTVLATVIIIMDFNYRTKAYLQEMQAVLIDSKYKVFQIYVQHGRWIPFKKEDISWGMRNYTSYDSSVHGLEEIKGQKATKYLKPEIKERLVAEYMQSL